MSMLDIQKGLERLGFDPGPLDGAYGPLARDAVRQCQAAYRLPADGMPGPDLRRLLRLPIPTCRMTAVARRGDTLAAMAQACNTTVEALRDGNRRKQREDVHPGEPLVVHKRVAGAFHDGRALGGRWTFCAQPAFGISAAGDVTLDLPVECMQETAAAGSGAMPAPAGTRDTRKPSVSGDAPSGFVPRGYFAVLAGSEESNDGTRELVRRPSRYRRTVEGVARGAAAAGFSGVILDIGDIEDQDSDRYLRFAACAARECRSSGLGLGVVTPAVTRESARRGWAIGYDTEALGAIADFLLLEHMDPTSFWDEVVWACKVVHRWKLISMIELRPVLSEDGSVADRTGSRRSVRGKVMSWEELRLLRGRHVLREGRDEKSGVPYITYRSRGAIHRVWEEDAESLGRKLHAINRLNTLGVALRGVRGAPQQVLCETARKFIIL
ncbi:MAG: peptidoglycan-binding protein [Clostridia bacterium]|nr:peptidoglycan-binding protein [Clostridia bacterium]